MLKAITILGSIAAITPSCAQEVRVFNGGIEHVYGRNGQLLDTPELRARNQRAERQMRDEQRGGASLDQQRNATVQTSRRQTPKSWWNQVPQQPPKSWWNYSN